MYVHGIKSILLFSSLLQTALALHLDVRQAPQSAPTATIDSGPLRGKTTKLATADTIVNQFLGIPFARPPVGDLRFAAPEDSEPWSSEYDATEQPQACMQYFGPENEMRRVGMAIFNNPPAAAGESEDCLYLNVYAPSGGTADKPVLFWIHGGSGTFGSAALPLYDGSSFAAHHDIIVVAVNYRVNIFGFPTTTLLPVEQRNLGLLDNRLALDWTRRNIRAFGGDPEKVTIMGESAGAVAVGEFINTFADDPPFRAAVLQSGSALVIPSIGESSEEELWDELVGHLNCSDTSDQGRVSCVKDTPAETLRDVVNTNGLVFSKQYADNVTKLENNGRAWWAGDVAKVPIMIGSTTDEGSFTAQSFGNNATAFINTALGEGSEMATLLNTLYAPGSVGAANHSTGNEIISQIFTDMIFRCTSGFVANMTANLLDMPVWQYQFDAQVPSNTWDEWPFLGVYHASEIAYVFGTYPPENSTELDVKLSKLMQKQVADFVKDPEAGPGWPQWPELAILGVNSTEPEVTTGDVRELDAICAYWNLMYASMAPDLVSSGGLVGNGTAGGGAAEVVTNSAATNGMGAYWMGTVSLCLLLSALMM